MSTNDPNIYLERARQVRDALAEQLLPRADISLIDIGLDPEDPDQAILAVRIHVRWPLNIKALELPAEIDGIPVRVIAANYRLE